ncbi:MAG: hypothetical protein A3D92_08045 [Bacteroidetes bacterium RIFCSPHIGHO2_02_FULL_44_7]|nr:MAG: hypothetical protein A3D92_08045 [Bacteroidetes bacterium RIFCSPHIGHO2_02_FULL_44_7]
MPEQFDKSFAPLEKKDEPLLTQLRQISAEEVRKILDEKTIDPAVGIVVAKFDKPPFEFEGQIYSVYAARVRAKKKSGVQPYVTPHLHEKGSEPYKFLSNDGEMNFGKVEGRGVKWLPPLVVSNGQEIVIKQGEVHSFRNNGIGDADFVFACPDSHLQDYDKKERPNGDRFIVKGLKGGTPPHYEVTS